MKILQDHFTLINNLSRSEKRYFKQKASLYSKTKDLDYLTLFDIISNQKEFDEDKLKKQVQKAGIRNISSKAKYLFDALLDSIGEFEKNQNPLSQLFDEYRKIMVLANKGLPKNANAKLLKLKARCYEMEAYFMLVKLLELEENIFRIKHHGRYTELYSQIIEEKNTVHEILNNQILYQNLNSEIFNGLSSIKERPKIIAFMTAVMEKPLMKSEEAALSKLAKSFYFRIRTIVLFFSEHFDKKEIIANSFKGIQLVEGSHLSEAVKIALFQNYFVCCSKCDSHEDFKIGMEIFEAYKFEHSQYQILQKAFKYGFGLEYVFRFHESQKEIDQFLNDYQEFCLAYKDFLHLDRKVHMFFYLLHIYIKLEKYTEAYNWSDHFFEVARLREWPPEEKIAFLFVKVIIYYELRLTRLLNSEINSIVYLKNKFKIEDQAIKKSIWLFKALQNAMDGDGERKLLGKYNETINPKVYKVLNVFRTGEIVSQWSAKKLEKYNKGMQIK